MLFQSFSWLLLLLVSSSTAQSCPANKVTVNINDTITANVTGVWTLNLNISNAVNYNLSAKTMMVKVVKTTSPVPGAITIQIDARTEAKFAINSLVRTGCRSVEAAISIGNIGGTITGIARPSGIPSSVWWTIGAATWLTLPADVQMAAILPAVMVAAPKLVCGSSTFAECATASINITVNIPMGTELKLTVDGSANSAVLCPACSTTNFSPPPGCQHSISPSVPPTKGPSSGPSASPTKMPSKSPSAGPSSSPSVTPTKNPSMGPSSTPSKGPSSSPSGSPSNGPSSSPSRGPSGSPSNGPSGSPSSSPSGSPSGSPSNSPSGSPVTLSPSGSPSNGPSSSPVTLSPSGSPITLSPSTQSPVPSAPMCLAPGSVAPSGACVCDTDCANYLLNCAPGNGGDCCIGGVCTAN